MRRCFSPILRRLRVLTARRPPKNRVRVQPNVCPLSLFVCNTDASTAENAVSTPLLNLTELHVVDSGVNPEFLSRVAAHTELRTLEMRHLEGNWERSLNFLSDLVNVETLVLDDLCFTDGDLSPVLRLPKLKELTLGVRDPACLTPYPWANCSAKLRLILHGPQNHEGLQILTTIPNLVEIEFRDFGRMVFPRCIRSLTRLEALSFVNGVFSRQPHKRRPLFPDGLRRFSSVGCSIDEATFENIFYSGRYLTELELSLDCVSGNLIMLLCENLQTLKLYGKEFDSEALLFIALFKHLRALDIGGCLGLRANHISYLHGLQQLEKISISNSFVPRDACSELASLQHITSLAFYSCLGVHLASLADLNACATVRLANCPGVAPQAAEFLEGALVQNLDCLSLSCEMCP